MNVVDSSGWLAYFADEPTADFFAESIEDTDLLVVPAVCIYEVFKVVLRERGEDDAFSAVAAMQQGTVIDLDADLALEAASVGLEEGLAFADSVLYTIAKKHRATLWNAWHVSDRAHDAQEWKQPRIGSLSSLCEHPNGARLALHLSCRRH